MIYAVELKENARKNKAALEHKAGRFLLKYGLSKEYGIDLAECTVLKNEHGKPYLNEHPDIFFNISHCKAMAVCALGSAPVGIDVETMRKCSEGLMKRVLSEAELEAVKASGADAIEFIKYWTLKEAYGKAVGVGMLYNYASMSFRAADGNITCPDNKYRVWQKIMNDELVISVCRMQNEEFEEAIEFIEPDYNELEE